MAGQVSGAGAGFCCPLLRAGIQSAWTTGAYFDALGVEGAHSCVAISTGASLSQPAAVPYCSQQTFGSASHLMTSMQMSVIAASGTPQGVLSYASQLGSMGGTCPFGTYFLLGGNVTEAATRATAWSWMDGTPATNLNCGSQSCGLWYPGEPK